MRWVDVPPVAAAGRLLGADGDGPRRRSRRGHRQSCAEASRLIARTEATEAGPAANMAGMATAVAAVVLFAMLNAMPGKTTASASLT